MFIEPFKVELWMNEWETQCTYNLAETCVASITVEELLSLSGRSGKDLSDLLPMKLGYGDIVGSPRLRSAIANLYADQHTDDITITHGTIAANMLVHKALVSTGDRVVSIVPTYQQHYSIPASIEASVATLNLRKEDDFLPDLDRLRELVTPDTKLIALTNPNNPTGAVATREQLKAWVDYARSNNALILFDAAYEAFIQDPDLPHSIFEIEGARDCAIEFRSFSKNAGFTGTRCALTVVPKGLKGKAANGEEVELWSLWNRRQSTKFNGVSYIIQRGAEAVYSAEGQTEVKALVNFYMENASIIRRELSNAGLTVYGGEHAPYVWIKTPDGMDSWGFFDHLLNKANVVGTPGSGFGARACSPG